MTENKQELPDEWLVNRLDEDGGEINYEIFNYERPEDRLLVDGPKAKELSKTVSDLLNTRPTQPEAHMEALIENLKWLGDTIAGTEYATKGGWKDSERKELLDAAISTLGQLKGADATMGGDGAGEWFPLETAPTDRPVYIRNYPDQRPVLVEITRSKKETRAYYVDEDGNNFSLHKSGNGGGWETENAEFSIYGETQWRDTHPQPAAAAMACVRDAGEVLEVIPTPCGDKIKVRETAQGREYWLDDKLVWRPSEMHRVVLQMAVLQEDKYRHAAIIEAAKKMG